MIRYALAFLDEVLDMGSQTFDYETSILECIAGHYLEADTCVACPRGEWKVAGNATFCNDCPGNQTTENNGTTSEQQCGRVSDKTKFIQLCLSVSLSTLRIFAVEHMTSHGFAIFAFLSFNPQ